MLITGNYKYHLQFNTMKYIIYTIFILCFPALLPAQIDSVTYTKVGTEWLRREHKSEEVPTPYTTEDSLVAKTLIREQLDLSRQYREAYLQWRKTQRAYTSRLRQNKAEYKKHFNGNLPIDSLVNSKELLGKWLLNDELITIAKKLEIKSAKINFISDVQFEVVIDGKKENFFKLEENWITDDEVYKLVKVRQINR